MHDRRSSGVGSVERPPCSTGWGRRRVKVDLGEPSGPVGGGVVVRHVLLPKFVQVLLEGIETIAPESPVGLQPLVELGEGLRAQGVQTSGLSAGAPASADRPDVCTPCARNPSPSSTSGSSPTGDSGAIVSMPSSSTWTTPGRSTMPDNHPTADGTVETGPDGSTQVHFVRRLPHPVERVWQALTDPAELRRWWGAADLDLTDGGRFTLRFAQHRRPGQRRHPRRHHQQARPTPVPRDHRHLGLHRHQRPSNPDNHHLGARPRRRPHPPPPHQHDPRVPRPPRHHRPQHHRHRLAPAPRGPRRPPLRRPARHRPPGAAVRADPPGLHPEVRSRVS